MVSSVSSRSSFKFHVADTVRQVGRGIGYDSPKNRMNGFVIIKAIISQKFGRIFFSPALVVDTKVNASVEGQGDILDSAAGSE